MTIALTQKGDKENYRFHCTRRKNCRAEIPVRKGRFFEHSRVQIKLLVWFIYFLARDYLGHVDYQLELTFADHAIGDGKNFIGDVCSEDFIQNPIQLGSPGEGVEIDECMLVRRKFNVGHVVNEQWVFGGYQCLLLTI